MMKIIPINNKDNLVYFMQSGTLSLGQYDLKFIQNILFIITQHKPLTTNQVELFDKLTDKYKRQLNKFGLSKQKISSLQWNVSIISSDIKYTQAYISIIDGKIIFKSPFSKKFIEIFRKQENNNFTWIKNDKHYEAEYTPYQLKLLVNTSRKVYPTINYCEKTSSLLNNVDEYSDAKIWNPTLVRVNNRYMIAAANEFLMNAIKDNSLEPTVENLFQLSRFGIHVDDTITNNDPLLNFASKFIVEMDFVNADTIVEYLKSIKCDAVVFLGNTLFVNRRKPLQQKLLDNLIVNIHDSKNLNFSEKLKYKNIVAIKPAPHIITILDNKFHWYRNISKLILLKDSSPIHII